jgi:small multidrug resistance pump
MSVAWVLLFVAVVIEVFATASLPRTDGFTNLWWTVFVLGGYGVATWLLSVIVRSISVSITYAVWSGLGTAMVAVIGYFFLGEEMTWLKAICLGLIVIGVVGLNVTGSH